MTETEIKNIILRIFNEERQKPDTDFSESHFLDFLTFPAHSKNTIKNTFKGVRRYYRFMGKLELEFGICFSIPDLDKYYSIDSITKKVIERINKRRGNLMILKRRNEEKDKYGFEITMTILLNLRMKRMMCLVIRQPEQNTIINVTEKNSLILQTIYL